ncbi:MAG: NUDIX hydrolase [Gammaproteobacteria bacterium]|nr:NUDIX hydrolase [Gammaproteobacteria bacterium]
MATISAETDYIQPAVTADTALFSVRGGELVALTVRREREPFAGWWALPGDYIRAEEALDDCAARALAEQTGLDAIYLEQLYTFASHYPGRWGRVFNVAYFALVPFAAVSPRNDENIAWQALSRLPRLAFNHEDILASARRRLAAKIEYSALALGLLPEVFTLAEVQAVYEAIKGERLDKRNFRRALLALDQLEVTGEKRQSGAHRPARLYRLREPSNLGIIG